VYWALARRETESKQEGGREGSKAVEERDSGESAGRKEFALRDRWLSRIRKKLKESTNELIRDFLTFGGTRKSFFFTGAMSLKTAK